MDVKIVQAEGKWPHVKWLSLDGQGKMATECAILKVDQIGNISFIRLKDLDSVDRQRMFDILSSRSVAQYELWDVMANRTLGNGMNALRYFHQYAKIVSPRGEIYTAQAGQVGTPTLKHAGTIPGNEATVVAEGAEAKSEAPNVPKSKSK